MSRTEHRPKTPSTKTGPLAALFASLPTTGTPAPAGFRAPAPSRRARRVPAVLCGLALALAATLLLTAASASAATPALTLEPVTNVAITNAEVHGTVDPGGEPTTYYIQFTTQGAYEAEGFGEQTQSPIVAELEGSGPQPVGGVIGAMHPNTEYRLRLYAENGSGHEEIVEAATFTTQAATVPTLAIEPATSVAYTTAHLAATVDPEGGSVNPIGGAIPIGWEFELNREAEGWGPAPAPGGVIEVPASEESNPVIVEANLEGLTNGSHYEFRLHATYADSESAASAAESFQTLEVTKPTVTIEAPTAVTATSAHFTGQINPGGSDPTFAVTYHFECTPACPSAEAPASLPAGESPQAVSATGTHLQPDTPYKVVLSAENLGGTETAGETFATLPAPIATIFAPTDITTTSLTLHGSLEAHGLPGTYFFQISSSTSPYQGSTPPTALPAGPDPIAVSAALGELPAAGSYTATLVITTAAGSARSEPLKFQTAAFPPPPPSPGPPVDQAFACADPNQSVTDGCGYPSRSVKHRHHKKHRRHKHHAKHRKGSRR